MSKPFDAILKDLAVVDPIMFLTVFDAPPVLPVRLLNVDLSTVTAATDVAFGLGDPLEEVVHLDAQAGPDADKHRDVLAYNALLHRQYKVPVHSILLLLRSQARLRSQTGNIRYAPRANRGKMEFDYEVVPIWERPVEALLASGLATLPLAPLCRLPQELSREEGMRRVLGEVVRRLEQEGTPELARRLLMATFVLSGLVLDLQQLRTHFQGVRTVRESVAYQLILEEGRIEQLHRTLLQMPPKRIGEPDEMTRQAILAMTDVEQLEGLCKEMIDGSSSSWPELLARARNREAQVEGSSNHG
jgi:hypothetical protein